MLPHFEILNIPGYGDPRGLSGFSKAVRKIAKKLEVDCTDVPACAEGDGSVPIATMVERVEDAIRNSKATNIYIAAHSLSGLVAMKALQKYYPNKRIFGMFEGAPPTKLKDDYIEPNLWSGGREVREQWYEARKMMGPYKLTYTPEFVNDLENLVRDVTRNPPQSTRLTILGVRDDTLVRESSVAEFVQELRKRPGMGVQYIVADKGGHPCNGEEVAAILENSITTSLKQAGHSKRLNKLRAAPKWKQRVVTYTQGLAAAAGLVGVFVGIGYANSTYTQKDIDGMVCADWHAESYGTPPPPNCQASNNTKAAAGDLVTGLAVVMGFCGSVAAVVHHAISVLPPAERAEILWQMNTSTITDATVGTKQGVMLPTERLAQNYQKPNTFPSKNYG